MTKRMTNLKKSRKHTVESFSYVVFNSTNKALKEMSTQKQQSKKVVVITFFPLTMI